MTLHICLFLLLSQLGRDYTKPLWKATPALLEHLIEYHKTIEQRCMEAKATGLKPDGGELAREVKAYLEENLGIPVGSFDVDQRLPAKDKDATMDVGKFFALCPKEGMVDNMGMGKLYYL